MFEKPSVVVWDDDVFKLTVWNAVKNGRRVGMQTDAYVWVRDEAIGKILKGGIPRFYSLFTLERCYWKAQKLHPRRIVSLELLAFLCEHVAPLPRDTIVSPLLAAQQLDQNMRRQGRTKNVLDVVGAPGEQKLIASEFCQDRLGLGFEIPLLNDATQDTSRHPRFWNKAHPL